MATTTRPAAAFVEALLGVHRVVMGGLGAALTAHGASLDQWRVLRSLTETGCTMGELTKALDIPPASLTRVVDSLATGALVYRRADLSDRRLVVIHLSKSGAERLAEWDDALAAGLMELRGLIGAASFDSLDRALRAAHRVI